MCVRVSACVRVCPRRMIGNILMLMMVMQNVEDDGDNDGDDEHDCSFALRCHVR